MFDVAAGSPCALRSPIRPPSPRTSTRSAARALLLRLPDPTDTPPDPSRHGHQYWFSDTYVLGGGAGLAVLATNPLQHIAKSDRVAELGFGLTMRAEWVFARFGKNALAMTGDSFLSFLGGAPVFAHTMTFKWQLR